MIENFPLQRNSATAWVTLRPTSSSRRCLPCQLDFYTHTFGLTAAQAGTMTLVIGLGVAFLNPVMGVIADRTSTKMGASSGHGCFGQLCPSASSAC